MIRWKSLLGMCCFAWAILACDVSQFDPSVHRDRYEQERLNSNIKRLELTENGKLPEQEASSK